MSRFSFIRLVLSILLLSQLHPVYSNDFVEKREHMKQRDRELLQLEKKRRNIALDESISIDELKALEKRMRVLDQEIYQNSQMIAETQKRMNELQKNIKVRQKKIGYRMRDIYLQRDTNDLLNASSLVEFASRLTHLLYTMRVDREGLKDFQQVSSSLKDVKQQLTSQLNALLARKREAERMLSTLQEKQEKTKIVHTSLNKRMIELESENEKEQAAAFHLILSSIEKEREKEIGQIPSGAGGTFYWPVDGGPITSTFGYRFDPVLKANQLHRGLDIGGALGTPIKSALAGRVIESRPSRGYGYIVVIYHGRGLSTLYAHMYGWTVRCKVGDLIHRGQIIAGVGSNGWSTGPHLHFEVIEEGKPKNPINYFSNTYRR